MIIYIIALLPRWYCLHLPFSCVAAQVRIPIVRQTKQSKGVAFVQFATQEAADAAREALHQNSFQGRLLKVTPAMAQPGVWPVLWL